MADHWGKLSKLKRVPKIPKPRGVIEANGSFYFTKQLVESNQRAAYFVKEYKNMLTYDIYTDTWKF